MIESTLEKPMQTPFPGSAARKAAADQADVPLSRDLPGKMNAYWRAANYLPVGQIYLYDNPLLKEPLTLSHVKPLVVGPSTRMGLAKPITIRCSPGTSTSYSASMDTPGWCTGSPTAGPTAICTCAATKKKEPSRLRST